MGISSKYEIYVAIINNLNINRTKMENLLVYGINS